MIRSYSLVATLLQSTGTCKNKLPACAGGYYEPAASPRRAETAPHYNTCA